MAKFQGKKIYLVTYHVECDAENWEEASKRVVNVEIPDTVKPNHIQMVKAEVALEVPNG